MTQIGLDQPGGSSLLPAALEHFPSDKNGFTSKLSWVSVLIKALQVLQIQI